MRQLYFLAGFPRSGSTVLSALLNQHPDMHVSPTSGLSEVMFKTFQAWKGSLAEQAAPDINQARRMMRSLMEAKYEDIEKPFVMDKSRSWAQDTTLGMLKDVLPYKPKIVATVRNVEDCAASLVRVAKPTDLTAFLRDDYLLTHLKEAYQALMTGYTMDPSCFLLVEYDDLLNDPMAQLRRVEEFLELSPATYDLEHLDKFAPKERDSEVWQVNGLHDIKPKLERQHNQSSEDVLQHMYRNFVQPRFWKGETTSKLPIHDLDIMLSQGLIGNLDEAEKIGEKLAMREPRNDRAAFNRGWYALRRGHLLDGHKLIFRGRHEGVFGNPAPKVPTPLWDGTSKGTILLYMEGGLGDQIHGAGMIRYMVKKGCDVIIACSGELAYLFKDIPGVRAVVQHEAAFGVVHDFWVPAMSAVIPLQLQYQEVDGSPYIEKPRVIRGKKFRIGLRWQGNPQFEHQQHRLFPSQGFFDAVKGFDAEYISLQRDEGAQHRPNWVKQVPLNHWAETQNAIASCDLVITSCTSVAHLAGAMGVETWIIVPILPYYLWAKPGEKTEWYDSVRLFRQEVYGSWEQPFRKIHQQLSRKIGGDDANQNRILDSGSEWGSQAGLGLQTS